MLKSPAIHLRLHHLLSLLLIVFILAFAPNVYGANALRFRITLSPAIAQKPLAGRLLVFMTNSTEERKTLASGFVPGGTWLSAMEVETIAPDQAVEFDPNTIAYPHPFSQAATGTYQVMALLDPDHTYAYHGQDEGDLYSSVVKISITDSSDTKPIELQLDHATAARARLTDTDNIKLYEFQSPSLTAFWGRPITMRAGIVLPPHYNIARRTRYPTVYHVHGFGGDHTSAWRQGQGLIARMNAGKQMEMVHVYLDGSFPTGHHEFADSVNNGPWGGALTKEFIPALENKYRLVKRPAARFLTGHSSGGWSTLWLQVTYPDFFGGTWSTAPDPVDLRSFTGIDATPGSIDNAYLKKDGTARNLVREGGKDIATLEEFARQEAVQGAYGGQFASFEWVWSPRGIDGRPMKLFNRETGALDQDVMRAWRKYDIRLTLDRNWATLGPKLRGKLNVIVGGEDTFHLEEAVIKLCDFFQPKKSDAVCEIIPERDHSNLYQPATAYPDGLAARIATEMERKYKASIGQRAGGRGARRR